MKRSTVRKWLGRLLDDESGQDLVEYALLTTFIGLAGVATFAALAPLMGQAYGSWDAGLSGLWEPPDPGAP